MAGLNNTSIEPLTILSDNIENGVNLTKWNMQLNWKKIVTWCFIAISSIILIFTMLTTIMVLVMHSTSRSHLEEIQVSNQSLWTALKKFNSTLFNIEKSQTKYERILDKDSKALPNQAMDNYNEEKVDLDIENERHELASNSSVLNTSHPLIEEKVKGNNENISWKTFLVKTLLTLG